MDGAQLRASLPCTVPRPIGTTRADFTQCLSFSRHSPPCWSACRFEISCYSIGFEEIHYSNDYMNQVVIITDELQILDARTLLHYKIGPRPKARACPAE